MNRVLHLLQVDILMRKDKRKIEETENLALRKFTLGLICQTKSKYLWTSSRVYTLIMDSLVREGKATKPGY